VHRITIRLYGHHVRLDPPQHVATLAVEHEDGRVLELMPATGDENDDGVAVVRQLPMSPPLPTTAEEDHTGPGIEAHYLNRFPLVSEINLANLPNDYKRTSISNVKYFDFVPGERYAVTLVSEVTLQAIVVAG